MPARPLHVRLRPSRVLAVLNVAAHVGACAALVPLDVPVWCAISLTCCIAGSLLHAWRRRADPHRVEAIDVEPSGLRVHRRGRASVSAIAVHGTVLHPWLVVLWLHCDDATTLALPILPDMAPAEDLRRLRVRLKVA